jgi:hypothetical protein
MVETITASTLKTWSGLFPVHPAADVFPMMTDDELDKLAEDIKANGLRHSVVLWTDNSRPYSNREMKMYATVYDARATYYVLDGRNRLAALDRAGIPVPAEWRGFALEPMGTEVFKRVCAWAWSQPGGRWEKRPGVDPAAFVIGATCIAGT